MEFSKGTMKGKCEPGWKDGFLSFPEDLLIYLVSHYIKFIPQFGTEFYPSWFLL
jgi:hypothetical protein